MRYFPVAFCTPLSLFNIWTNLKISEKIPGAPTRRWGEWIWLTGPTGLHWNSPQGLNISSIKIFDQIRDLEISITLRPLLRKGTLNFGMLLATLYTNACCNENWKKDKFRTIIKPRFSSSTHCYFWRMYDLIESQVKTSDNIKTFAYFAAALLNHSLLPCKENINWLEGNDKVS